MAVPVRFDEVTKEEYIAFHVNRIQKEHKDLRQMSKAPSFAMQFLGTYRTLMKNLGWSESQAKGVEANYKKLYQKSIDWVNAKIEEAHIKGYSEGAFGLRIRTPLLAQTIYGASKLPKEAAAEARTLGNAISGQSYGLLNNRAASAFMKKVWASEFKTDIKPVALIHDACYFIIKDDVRVVEWVNNNLIKEMSWQDLPEIAHDEVKLGAELDIFYKGWHQPVTLPNGISQEEMKKLCKEKAESYDKEV